MSETEQPETSPLPAMIDTHCHLDDAAFADDLGSVLETSRAANVVAWILIGYAPERWDSVIEMARGVPGMSHTLGVHPSHAAEWDDAVAARLRGLLETSGAVAVGEFGLDFYRDNPPLTVQREAMVGQLEIARDLGLPAVFHMRNAEAEMLDILVSQRELPLMLFHSFEGTSSLADFIIEREAFVGVGGLATRQRSAELREQLRRIPLESIVLETDSPYLVPARQKDRRNVPAHVRTVALFLADFYGLPVNDLVDQTTRNAERLFGRLLP
jgi:TatD DNase family protein